jgi:hypothetical protein
MVALVALFVFTLFSALFCSALAFWRERNRRVTAEGLQHFYSVQAQALWHYATELATERDQAVKLAAEVSESAARLQRGLECVAVADELIASLVKTSEASADSPTCRSAPLELEALLRARIHGASRL